MDAAVADDHYPYGATHYIERSGEILGAFNVGPFTSWWIRTDQSVFTSLRAIKMAQALQEFHGWKATVLLVPEHSPYFKYMERLGFAKGKTSYRMCLQMEPLNGKHKDRASPA